MTKQMAQGVIHFEGRSLMLAIHTAQPPNNKEWSAYMDMASALLGKATVAVGLAITDGGGPNSAQRATLARAVAERNGLRGAAITNSAMVRGIMTALGWTMGGQFKAFSPSHFRDALEHLGIATSELRNVLNEAINLQSQLPPVKTLQVLVENTR